jgi:hypothetical protein
MTFYLWCSCNSLMDNSILLRLFQRTLTCVATKWYIERSYNSFVKFNSFSMDFSMHFQLPIWYDTGIELLISLQKSSSTHISDHIHEWRWWIWLLKLQFRTNTLQIGLRSCSCHPSSMMFLWESYY